MAPRKPRPLAAVPDDAAKGPIMAAVAAYVVSIHPDERVAGHDVFAAQAANLARVLDAGTAALAIAAVHRELRELVEAMTVKEEADDGDPRTADLLARLSSPLGYPAN